MMSEGCCQVHRFTTAFAIFHILSKYYIEMTYEKLHLYTEKREQTFQTKAYKSVAYSTVGKT